MKKLILCAAGISLSTGVSVGADLSYSLGPVGGGAWETAANWQLGALPGTDDSARPSWGTTADSHTVTLNSAQSVKSVQNGVNRQGTLTIGAGGNLTSSGGAYNSVAWNDGDASFVILIDGGQWNITSGDRLAIGRQDNAAGSALDIYSGSALSMLNDLEFNDGTTATATVGNFANYMATVHDGGSATVGRLQFNGGFGLLDVKNGGSVTISSNQVGYVADAITAGNIVSSDGALSVSAFDNGSMTIMGVPEPTTSTLFGVFGAALLLKRRRTRNG